MRHILFLLALFSVTTHADTIDHFMNIVNNIPQMEMKADAQSQAWARSARNILALTSESIAESLILANDTATSAGKPLFCLNDKGLLTADTVNQLIQQTYRDLSSQESDKNKMTVSQVALLGISKRYPCPAQSAQMAQFQQAIQHVGRAN
jgi:hypothetical protein